MRKMLICVVLLASAAALAQEEERGSAPRRPPPEDKRPPLPGEPAVAVEAEPEVHKLFGVGAGGTMAGLRGIEAEIYLADVMIDGHFALSLFNQDPKATFGAAVGVFYRLKLFRFVALMPGARFALGYRTTSGYVPGGEIVASSVQVAIETPLRVEIYLGDLFSVHAELGPVFTFITQGTGTLGQSWAGVAKGVYIEATHTDLIGPLAFSVFLN